VYPVFALCFFTINMAGMLKGAAKVIRQVIGGQVPVNQIVLAMTVIFVLNSFAGGFLPGWAIVAVLVFATWSIFQS